MGIMSRAADSRFAEVHLEAEDAPEALEVDSDRPFRILLAGDFSGRAWREIAWEPAAPIPIDRDNFEEVLAGMRITLDLDGVKLSFRELEDFHPDRIYGRVGAAAVGERDVPTAGLLDQVLAEHYPEAAAVSASDADDLAGFVRKVTAGHTVQRESPAARQREADRQELAAKLLRRILHHPRMQTIEAAWRALDLLVHELDTDGGLKLYVLDITLPELVRNRDAIQKQLRGKGPWALIAGNFTFGQSEVEAQALRQLGGMAKTLGAPFLAEARLSGNEVSERAWADLRSSEEAHWIGLAMPRFLLRLPYGKEGGSVESLPFEEMPRDEHNAYLWGNPAFACAKLAGDSFLAEGWGLGRRLARRIDGLPLHVYQEDGEAVAKPCAEILMTEQDAENLLEAGFMPLVSIKNEPAAMLLRWQSIAEPAAALAGLR